MLTAFITTVFLIIFVCLIIGLTYIDDHNLTGIFIIAIIIVIIFYTAGIVAINRSSYEKTSKVRVIPEIKVETIIVDNTVSKSDTTYIYKFKNE